MRADPPGIEITARALVPDLLARHPEARSVLDRYGLKGCGGRNGPHESLAFFARMHGVAEATLLGEIRAAIGRGDPAAGAEEALPSVADTIYRRYFLAGILTILTVGAGWGVWILWQIGFAGTFTGVSIHDVNAHGHAQIYGWVGLFIMGFAYQAFPRFWQTSLAAPRLAVVAFIAMVAGILVRTAGMTWHGADWALAGAMGGAAVQIAAIVIFVGQIVATYRRSMARFEPYLMFLFTGLGFFVAQALFSTWHTWTTMAAGSREELLWYVGTYQAVLRDLQIHGLALFMILGVSLRILPGFFGLQPIRDRLAYGAWGLLLVAVFGESIFFIGYRWTDNHALAGALLLPWILLAVGSLIIPWAWRLWRPLPSPGGADRSAKFIRAAYGWLALSMALLLMLPVYQIVSGIPFSHAYYGGIRHAITVGFISLMIMGVAAKVVPTLNGVDTRALSPLWGPFLLVNVGCFLRVSLQTLTDWHPLFFGVVGLSGLLELTGLAWWGIHLVGVMRRGKHAMRDDTDAEADAGPSPDRILGAHTVADVLRWFPQTEAVFVRLGFSLIRNPVLRRTVARRVTLVHAAAMRGVPLERMLDALNHAIGAATGSGGPAAGVRYDATIGDLLGRYPQLHAALAQWRPGLANSPGMMLGEAADLAGVNREELAGVIARAVAGPTGGCGKGCADCGGGGAAASQACPTAAAGVSG